MPRSTPPSTSPRAPLRASRTWRSAHSGSTGSACSASTTAWPYPCSRRRSRCSASTPTWWWWCAARRGGPTGWWRAGARSCTATPRPGGSTRPGATSGGVTAPKRRGRRASSVAASLVLGAAGPPLRRWDRAAAGSASRHLANSTATAELVRRLHGLAAEMLHPGHARARNGRSGGAGGGAGAGLLALRGTPVALRERGHGARGARAASRRRRGRPRGGAGPGAPACGAPAGEPSAARWDREALHPLDRFTRPAPWQRLAVKPISLARPILRNRDARSWPRAPPAR